MQRQDAIDRLDLENDLVSDDNVRAIATIEVKTVLFDWELDLASAGYCVALEFMA